MSNDVWNIDTADELKEIKLLIRENPNQLPLKDYLSSISDLNFTVHASEMRYGETYYFRGKGTNVRAIILPTKTLSVIPRQYRKQEWFFVRIFCHPTDVRFDTFPNYHSVPAYQYNI